MTAALDAGWAYWGWAAGLALAAFGGTVLLMPPLIAWLRRRAVWDLPNARSSHSEATPRGGGIAVTAAILLAGIVWLTLAPDISASLALAGAAMLALVSWIDDRRHGGLPAGQRLAVQAIAVGLVLVLLPPDSRMTGDWLPLWIERAFCFLAWLWFTNLFNFMDGINGIAGTEMVSVGLGLALVQLAAGLLDGRMAGSNAGLALILAGAGAGFLPSNWNRAKVFLGDVGSVPAGFLLGWLLLDAAMQGFWAAALILPLYYWADATATLLRRLLRREKIWQAHNDHFYQQGVRKFGAHATVARRIAGLNLALVAFSLAAIPGWPLSALAVCAALLAVLMLCRHFALPAKTVE